MSISDTMVICLGIPVIISRLSADMLRAHAVVIIVDAYAAMLIKNGIANRRLMRLFLAKIIDTFSTRDALVRAAVKFFNSFSIELLRISGGSVYIAMSISIASDSIVIARASGM